MDERVDPTVAADDAESFLAIFRDTMIGMVQQRIEFTARQLAIFLTCYMRDDTHTVGSLAAEHKIPLPAVSHALDRLKFCSIIERSRSTRDRRKVIVSRTRTGQSFLGKVRAIAREAADPYTITLKK